MLQLRGPLAGRVITLLLLNFTTGTVVLTMGLVLGCPINLAFGGFPRWGGRSYLCSVERACNQQWEGTDTPRACGLRRDPRRGGGQVEVIRGGLGSSLHTLLLYCSHISALAHPTVLLPHLNLSCLQEGDFPPCALPRVWDLPPTPTSPVFSPENSQGQALGTQQGMSVRVPPRTGPGGIAGETLTLGAS